MIARSQEIRRAMARDADEKEGMVLLGKCFAARGEYEVAEKEFVAVLGAMPADDTAALELASVYRAMGRPADALRRVVGLLRANVYHFAALVVLGESLLDLKRTRDAARAFARVLKFDPNHSGGSQVQQARIDGGALMAIEGPLQDIGIHDVFQLLDLARKSGRLSVRSTARGNEGRVYFDRARSFTRRCGTIRTRSARC